MRVVFLDDVPGVALGGEVKEVKNGFARNYLIPQKLAVAATRDALQRVAKLGNQAEIKRLKTLQDMKALSEVLDGVRVDVDMRAGASGRLYGSVTNAIVAEKLAELTDREIDRRTIELAEPIRELGTFELNVRLHPEVIATVNLLVYPSGSEPDEFLTSWLEEAAAKKEAEVAEAESEEAAEDTDTVPVPDAASTAEDTVSETDQRHSRNAGDRGARAVGDRAARGRRRGLRGRAGPGSSRPDHSTDRPVIETPFRSL